MLLSRKRRTKPTEVEEVQPKPEKPKAKPRAQKKVEEKVGDE
jgi:hypothetical protein